MLKVGLGDSDVETVRFGMTGSIRDVAHARTLPKVTCLHAPAVNAAVEQSVTPQAEER
jgi:hypothetical protein